MSQDNLYKRGITPIGKTNHRSEGKLFGIKDKDRLGHIYVIGKTGTGKSTLLLNMAISDIERGNGLALIDPHGDIADEILNYIPESRIEDVIYFNPQDTEYPIAFNPLHGVHPNYHHLVASGLISIFKKLWADSWGPRLEYILRYSLLTLLWWPNGTILDVQPLLTDIAFRKHVLTYVKKEAILSFWQNEYEKYTPSFRNEAIASILNKTGVFETSIPLKQIVGQKTTSFRMQQVMDGKKILIANLSKGAIGEDTSSILGSMLITSIQLAALYRSVQKEENRIPFHLYIDEMHSFLTLSFTGLLAESRKYGLGLFLAHQFMDQLSEKVRKAILGNVGTIMSFRIGAEDAEYLAKEFYPIFGMEDLVNLSKHSIYLKLLIDGTTSQPFSAATLPLKDNKFSFRQEIIQLSQKKYGKPKKAEKIWKQIKDNDAVQGGLFNTV